MEEQPSILLVEDHPDVADLYQLKLQLEGYRVAIAHDGMTGLELARSLLPDIVLLDMHLPKLHGLRLLQALRADDSTRKLVVIVFTEDESHELRTEALRFEAVAYLIKAQILPSTLAKVVREALNGQGPPAEVREFPPAEKVS
jgi:CheY-like chemotaxis protein